MESENTGSFLLFGQLRFKVQHVPKKLIFKIDSYYFLKMFKYLKLARKSSKRTDTQQYN